GAYAVALYLLRAELGSNQLVEWWGSAAQYLAIVIPSTLALAVLVSSDIVLVKHFFGAQQAGEYSAVAAIGRAIFWGASGVAAVLFPKVAFRAAKGEATSLVVLASFVLVGLGGLISYAVFCLKK